MATMLRSAVVLAIALFVCLPLGKAQSFVVRGISSSTYPTMSATIRAVDAQGRRVALTSADVRVYEDGVATTNVIVSCPPEPVVEPVSIVFGVDISASMNGENAMSTARSVVTGMLQMTPIPSCEAGIVSCNTSPVIVRDVTNRKTELLAAASTLDINGGTDLLAMFVTPQTGVLDVVRTRSKKRVVVIVTDGMYGAFDQTSYDQILTRCIDDGITVIGIKVTSGKLDTTGVEQSLRALAEATNGIYINDVTTPDAIRAATISAVGEMLRSDACTLTWTGGPVCAKQSRRKIRVEVAGVATPHQQDIEINTGLASSLSASPASLSIKAIDGVTTSVRVTAPREALQITSYTSSDPRFSIAPLPFALGAGESTDLTVTFTDDGATTFAYAVITLQGAPCGGSIPVMWFGGASAANVRVIEPNGGEELLAGSASVLRFAATDTTLPVAIDVSYDAGATWDTLASTARPTTWDWSPVPSVASDRCLLRVRQAANVPPTTADSLVAFQVDPTSLVMHPVSGFNILGLVDGGVMRYHRADQTYVGVWKDHRDTVTAVDAALERIASAGTDSVVVVRDAWHRDSVIARWSVGSAIRAMVFDDLQPTVLYTGSDDGRIIAWDAINGTRMGVVMQHAAGITAVAMDTTIGALLYGAADGTVGLVDLSTSQNVWQQRPTTSTVSAVRVAGGLYASSRSGEIVRLDRVTGTPTTLVVVAEGVQDMAVLGPSDTLMLVAAGNDSLRSYDVRTMVPTMLQTGPFGVRRVAFGRSTVDLAAAAGPGAVWDSPTGFPSLMMFRSGVFLLSTFETVLPIHATSELLVVSNYGLTTVHGPDGRVQDRFLLPPGVGTLTSTVTISRSGRFIAAVRNGRPYIMDREDPLRFEELFNTTVHGFVFDPRNEERVHCIESGRVRTFDMSTRTYTGAPFTTGVTPYRVTSNPSGTVAVLLDGWTITVLDPLAMQLPLRQFKIDSTELPTSLSLSNLGTLLVVAYRSKIVVYGLPTGDELGRTPASFTQYLGAACTPDAEQIVASCVTSLGSETQWYAVPSMTLQGRTTGPYRPGATLQDVCSASADSWAAIASDVGAITMRRLPRDGSDNINDVSDAVWSIIAPRATIRSVDMGRVRVGDQRDSVISQAITIAAPQRVTINGHTLIGADAGAFAVRFSSLPTIVSASTPTSIEVSFVPTRLGPHVGQCVLHTSSGDDTLTITGNGVSAPLRLTTTLIDLGAHVVGTTMDSTVIVVRNVSGTPVNILDVAGVGPDTTQFVVAPVVPGVLAANGDLTVDIRFAPVRIGRTTTILAIRTDDGLPPLQVVCFATGIGPSIAVRSDSGRPGDQRPITLYMSGPAGPVQGSGPMRFRSTVTYDATVVVPMHADSVSAVGYDGRATFTGTWGGADSVVGALPSVLVLGRSDRTPISVAEFTWLDDDGSPLNMDVELGTGVYRVLGVCRDANGRFFEPGANVGTVREVRFVDLLGREIDPTVHGLLLKVEVLTNGRVRTTPIMSGEAVRVVD